MYVENEIIVRHEQKRSSRAAQRENAFYRVLFHSGALNFWPKHYLLFPARMQVGTNYFVAYTIYVPSMIIKN